MEVQQRSLNNGLRVLLVNDQDSPSVTVMISVKVGARYETLNESGIAHLIEHNLFKGTHKRPSSKDIAYEVENLGAFQNAFTGKEGTSYYIKGPQDKAVQMLEILADMVCNPSFPVEDFEKEKKVIIEEIKMYEDIPQEKVCDYFLGNLFSENQLGVDIAGTVSTVGNIKVENCRRFMANYYTSNNMVLIISGKFNVEELLEKAAKVFDSLPRHEIIQPENYEETKLNLKVKTYTKDIEQTHIVIGGYAPNYQLSQRKILPFYLGRTILAGGMGSKLYQKIREELGIAYYIGMGGQAFKETGYYDIGLGVDHARVQEAIAAVFSVLRDFQKGHISVKEFERAKNLSIGSMVTAFETSDEVASWFGRQILQDQELVSGEEIIKMLKEISLDEVLTIWNKWLSNDNLQIITFGKLKSDLAMVKL